MTVKATVGSSDEGLEITQEEMLGGAMSPACVLRLTGEVDQITQEILMPCALKILRTRRYAAMVIDLSSVSFLDASGLAALLDLRKQANMEAFGQLCLVVQALVQQQGQQGQGADRNQPRDVLKLARFGRIMPIGGTVEEALQIASTFRTIVG